MHIMLLGLVMIFGVAYAGTVGDKRVNTILHTYARKGDVSGVRSLLKCGADPKAVNHRGATPLHNAAASGNVKMVKILIPVSKLDAQDSNGATALMVALAFGYERIATVLLDAVAFPNVAAHSGLTPLHVAATKGLEGAVTELLEYRADPFAKTKDGEQISSTHEKILFQLNEAREKAL